MKQVIIILFLGSVFGFSGPMANAGDFEALVPKINLEYWNDGGFRRDNNCYNYATNQRTDSFAQPGEASGEIYRRLSCKSVGEAAERDLGVVPATYFSFVDKSSETLIALVVGTGYDYHWYRRDDNLLWSHKPGGTAATSHDQAGEIIVDPETAERGPYTSFCGYYIVKSYERFEHEQDAGYVRVGNMDDLPLINDPADKLGVEEVEGENSVEVEEVMPPEVAWVPSLDKPRGSFVTAMKYSGRPNPKLSLGAFVRAATQPQNYKVWMAVSELQSRFSKLAFTKTPRQLNASRLGYQGVRIVDEKGVILPKGSALAIHGQEITLQYGNGQQKIVLDRTLGRAIETFALNLLR